MRELRKSSHKFPHSDDWTVIYESCKLLKRMEARVRIELTRKGFADLSLTTWVPRRLAEGVSWRCGQVVTPAQ
jgi:DNA-binding transcriptional regulator PaaX